MDGCRLVGEVSEGAREEEVVREYRGGEYVQVDAGGDYFPCWRRRDLMHSPVVHFLYR